jgi:hypothetical protein
LNLPAGFQGQADLDGNSDGINSAEESFAFTQPVVYLKQVASKTLPSLLST